MAKRKKRQEIDQQIEAFEKGGSLEEQLPPLKPRTSNQAHYIEAIAQNPLVFGLGPAGTGKTFIAASLAADAIAARKISKVIVTRPVIEVGERLGFLPGTLQEKFDPYFQPVWHVFVKRLGEGFAEYLMRKKVIEVVPLAYMRGYTFDHAFVIFDEAQNATKMQMKMFLTRIGERSRVIVNGDLEQVDLPGADGLADAVTRLRDVRGVEVVQFGPEDIVRSGLVQRIVQAYSEPAPAPGPVKRVQRIL